LYIAAQRRYFEEELQLVGEMQRSGVRMLAGTDSTLACVIPGFGLHDELALLVRAGLTPMQALQSATRDPAEFLGELDRNGTVEKGKFADLVLLDADPLSDIRNTAKIAAVIQNGRLFDNAAIRQMLSGVARSAAGN
jgi:imidazolonepropionase-like amidohydrolase